MLHVRVLLRKLKNSMFIVILVLFSCGSDDGNTEDPNGDVDLTGTLRYEVVGSAAGISLDRITYTGADGTDINVFDTNSPWEITISTDGFTSGDVLILEAMTLTTGHSITGRLSIDGQLEASETDDREISLSVTF